MFAVQISSPLTRNTKPEQQPRTNHMITTHESHDNHVRANRQPLTNQTAPHLDNMKHKALTLNTFQTLRCIVPRTLYSI